MPLITPTASGQALAQGFDEALFDLFELIGKEILLGIEGEQQIDLVFLLVIFGEQHRGTQQRLLFQKSK